MISKTEINRNMTAGRPKGYKKTGGRQKGVENHSTRSVKEALLKAYGAIGDDQAFAEWAIENRTEFYKLWSKIMPTEVNATGEMVMRFAPAFGRNENS